MSTPLKKYVEHPLPPKETLPTMDDLPSETAGESGMADFFHLWQPRLLDDTFQSPVYGRDEVCLASDVNLYYDVHNTKHHKRPDWFAAVGVKSGRQLRSSYVVWQEGVSPLVVIEFLSDCTEDEDLGRAKPRKLGDPATKWEVYEQALRIPYYVVFSRHTDELKVFKLSGARYKEVKRHRGRFWIEEIELGLGLWKGVHQDNDRLWLRWYDKSGAWIPTSQERLEQERAEKEKLAAKLRELGIDPNTI